MRDQNGRGSLRDQNGRRFSQESTASLHPNNAQYKPQRRHSNGSVDSRYIFVANIASIIESVEVKSSKLYPKVSENI